MATRKWRHLWTAAALFAKRLIVTTERLFGVGGCYSLNVQLIDVRVHDAMLAHGFSIQPFPSCDVCRR
jgi:hypothetical protein